MPQTRETPHYRPDGIWTSHAGWRRFLEEGAGRWASVDNQNAAKRMLAELPEQADCEVCRKVGA